MSADKPLAPPASLATPPAEDDCSCSDADDCECPPCDFQAPGKLCVRVKGHRGDHAMALAKAFAPDPASLGAATPPDTTRESEQEVNKSGRSAVNKSDSVNKTDGKSVSTGEAEAQEEQYGPLADTPYEGAELVAWVRLQTERWGRGRNTATLRALTLARQRADAAEQERDDAIQRAEWAELSAHTRAKQLDAIAGPPTGASPERCPECGEDIRNVLYPDAFFPACANPACGRCYPPLRAAALRASDPRGSDHE